MLRFAKRLPIQLHLASKSFPSAVTSNQITSKRSYFAEDGLAIETFRKHYDFQQRNNGFKIPSIKSTIQESLARPDGKIFTEDLKALLYSTRTDEDLDFLIKAIKRYQSHESLTMFSYSFDAPLARLLYILGKMDLAVKLSCEEDSLFKSTGNAQVLLMNKLVEEKRYDDAITVYMKLNKNSNKTPSSAAVELFFEALVEKNDPEALKLAQNNLPSLKDREKFDKFAKKTFLLALNQNQPALAYELITSMKNTYESTLQNFRIITLARLDRLQDALNVAKSLAMQQKAQNKNRYVFKETLEQLKKAAEATSDPVLKGKIIEQIESSMNNMFETSLRDNVLKLGLAFKKPDRSSDPSDSSRPATSDRRGSDQVFKTQPQQQYQNGPAQYNNNNTNRQRDFNSFNDQQQQQQRVNQRDSMSYNNSDRNSNSRRDSNSGFVGGEQRNFNPTRDFNNDFNRTNNREFQNSNNGINNNNNRNNQQQPLQAVGTSYNSNRQNDNFNRSHQYEPENFMFKNRDNFQPNSQYRDSSYSDSNYSNTNYNNSNYSNANKNSNNYNSRAQSVDKYERGSHRNQPMSFNQEPANTGFNSNQQSFSRFDRDNGNGSGSYRPSADRFQNEPPARRPTTEEDEQLRLNGINHYKPSQAVSDQFRGQASRNVDYNQGNSYRQDQNFQPRESGYNESEQDRRRSGEQSFGYSPENKRYDRMTRN